MSRYRRRAHHYYSSRKYGHAKAIEHIDAAKRLTKELGGADRTVKEWLFSLNGSELDRILDVYGNTYGRSAKSYAASTIPKWQSRTVSMGGMVAERLFTILPPFMPFKLKYEIVEGLWRNYGPSSTTTLWVSPEIESSVLMTDLQQRIDLLVTEYTIPTAMEARFSWLASDDVLIKQRLLNHLRETDKAMAVASAGAKIPVLLEHLRGPEGALTKKVSQTLEVGRHLLEVVFDRNAVGIEIARPRGPISIGSIGYAGFLLIGFVLLMYACSHH